MTYNKLNQVLLLLLWIAGLWCIIIKRVRSLHSF